MTTVCDPFWSFEKITKKIIENDPEKNKIHFESLFIFA
jgi:hypothetical protein